MRNIINLREVDDISIDTSESITRIFFKEPSHTIILDKDESEFDDEIELTILNHIQNKQFISITKLKSEIQDRLKNKKKRDEALSNKD